MILDFLYSLFSEDIYWLGLYTLSSFAFTIMALLHNGSVPRADRPLVQKIPWFIFICVTFPVFIFGAIVYALVNYKGWKKILPLMTILCTFAGGSSQLRNLTADLPETLSSKDCAKLDKERQYIEDYTNEKLGTNNGMDIMVEQIMAGVDPQDIEHRPIIIPLDVRLKMIRYETIAHAADTCGAQFPGFFDQIAGICGADYEGENDNFEKEILPLCEKALLNKDNKHADKILGIIIRHYTEKGSTHRNHQKVIEYIDKFFETNPTDPPHWWLLVKAEFLRYGGYGVEKDERASFITMNDLEASGEFGPQIKCDLSLYYRHGIGTTINEEQADLLLEEYQTEEPNKPCVHERMSVSN